MNRNNMVSIIIPVYNPGSNFCTLLESVSLQTEKDFEVLLIDDGSTDGAEVICDQYTRVDTRFKVFHQTNKGVSAARNKGIQEAEGDFITFLDADDDIPRNYIQTLLDTQHATNADIVVCDLVHLNDEQEMARFTYEPTVINSIKALELLLMRKNISTGPCAKLFCKDILRQTKFPPLKVYEDILFACDVFSNAEFVAITNKTEYRYIKNYNSAMQKAINSPSLDIIKATDDLMEYICKHSELDANCLYITLSHMMQYVLPRLNGRNQNEREFVKKAREVLRKYKWEILKCSAFPWKEKLVFISIAYRK